MSQQVDSEALSGLRLHGRSHVQLMRSPADNPTAAHPVVSSGALAQSSKKCFVNSRLLYRR